MLKKLLAVAFLVASSEASAKGACPFDTAKDCAGLFADTMTEVLKQGPISAGDFSLQSVTASDTTVTISHRASFSEADFAKSVPEAARDGYLEALRRGTKAHNCSEPAAGLIASGVTFKDEFRYADGGLLEELVTSDCAGG